MFKRGDIVKLKRGNMPIMVYAVDKYDRITGAYLSSHYDMEHPRTCEDFVKYEGEMTEHFEKRLNQLEREHKLQGKTNMKTLYETKDGRFGTKLATNSEGKSVLEMKGKNGKVEAFDPETLTEVVPYTVAIQFIEGPQQYGRTKNYHYISTKGAVAKGDIVFVEGSANMARVTRIDTKSRSATIELKGRKVKTTKI